MRMEKRALGISLAFASCLFSGLIPVATKFMSFSIAPFELTFLLNLLQLPFIIVLLKFERSSIPNLGKHWGSLLGLSALGLAGIALVNVGYSIGLATEGGFLSRAEPIFTALFAWLLLRERLGKWQWVGLGVGLVSAYAFSNSGPFGFSLSSTLFLSAAVVWGLSNIFARRLSGRLSAGVLNLARCSFATVILLPFTWRALLDLASVENGVILAFLYLGSNYLLYAAMRYVKAAEAASFLLVAPVITAVVSAAVLSETMGLAQIASGAVLIASIGLVAVAKGE